MEIISFETVISRLAQQQGYSPYVAINDRMELMLDLLPAAVIYNSTLVDKVGRERCRLTTLVKVKLIKSAVSCSQEAKNEMAVVMKRDAIDMLNAISGYDNVVDITGLKIEIEGGRVARYDGVAISFEATIVSNYNAFSEGVQLL